MSKKRYINTTLWRDEYIASLDPSEKLLFIYLLTCPDTTIAGIYQIPIKIIAADTGFDRDMVIKILARFETDGKVLYRDGWVAIKNFIKHQNYGSHQVQVGIEREFKGCPEWCKSFISDGLPDNIGVPEDRLTRRQAVLIRDSFVCAYCGKDIFDDSDYEVDHIIPETRGGGYNYTNLICACRDCNKKKSNMTAMEFCGKEVVGFDYHISMAIKKLQEDGSLFDRFAKMYPLNTIFKKSNTILNPDISTSISQGIGKVFIAPTAKEVQSYLDDRSITTFTANQFIDFYTARGWLIGKTKMKDWQAAVRTWESRAKSDPKRHKTTEELYG